MALEVADNSQSVCPRQLQMQGPEADERTFALMLAIRTILPCVPFSIICLAASRAQKNAPKTLTANVFLNRSVGNLCVP